MSAVRRFLAFWYDFLVGDDWLLAAGVVLALGLAALLVHTAGLALLALPLAVALVLTVSLGRAVRKFPPPL